MTEKLYDADAYAGAFSAMVLSCNEISRQQKKQYEVILDRTLFFPEEGGQTADTGTLSDIAVEDVQIHAGVIIHLLSEPLPAGQQVQGRINWEHRFSNMQQHSGEHIFSGIVHASYGYDNVGFHLSDSVVTMDYNGVLSGEQISKIEQEVNRVISLNLEIQISYPSAQELMTLQYRSKKEIDGQVRIVTVPGYDVCACCAPHVKRTGEIGLLKVVGSQKYKSGVRISILCGERALALFTQEHAMLTELAASLSTAADQIPGIIRKQQKDHADLAGKLQQAGLELMRYRLRDIPQNQENVIWFTEETDGRILRESVNLLTAEHSGWCAVFAGTDADGYRYIIGSAQKDARTAGRLLQEELGAKGGGSERMIQGQLQEVSAQKIQACLKDL
ncbi:MAG: alanyl-tRNA editing protein [Butyrivibrio sp.]|nr:alanyl-tRNA editing protein [Butyrivibrio sp.]